MISSAAVSLLLVSAVSAAPLFGTVSQLPAGNGWYAPLGAGAPPSGGYQCFYGNLASYPAIDKWISFQAMWQINSAAILSFSPPEQATVIQNAITSVAAQANVDPRLVLAMVMQESTGNPQVPCTGDGNCGLMQGPKGSVSFNPGDPNGSINQMIVDGVLGTSAAPGLVQYMNNDASFAYTRNWWTMNPYSAARCYNSGSVSPDGNLDTIQWGTKSYVNDIANRLQGWDGTNGDAVRAQCGLLQ